MKTCTAIILSCILWATIGFWGCKNSTSTGNGKEDSRKLLSAENIQGTWKTDSSANPDFKIEGDSIHFLESLDQVFPYQIKGDSLIIQFPAFEYGYKVEVFSGDSLRFLSEQMMMTYRKVE